MLTYFSTIFVTLLTHFNNIRKMQKKKLFIPFLCNFSLSSLPLYFLFNYHDTWRSSSLIMRYFLFLNRESREELVCEYVSRDPIAVPILGIDLLSLHKNKISTTFIFRVGKVKRTKSLASEQAIKIGNLRSNKMKLISWIEINMLRKE